MPDRPEFKIVRYADHYDITRDGEKVASGSYTYPQTPESKLTEVEAKYYAETDKT